MPIRCRFATSVDAAALTAMMAAMYRHYGLPGAEDEAAVARYVTETMLPAEAAGTCRVALAVDEAAAAPVGFGTMALLLPAPALGAQAYIKDLWVGAAARGRGAGRALIAFLAREAVAKGAVRVDWTAETTNPAAIAAYEAMGAPRVPEKVYFRLTGDDLARWAET